MCELKTSQHPKTEPDTTLIKKQNFRMQHTFKKTGKCRARRAGPAKCLVGEGALINCPMQTKDFTGEIIKLNKLQVAIKNNPFGASALSK